MSVFSQVAWKEGMFMVPQHFQQAERSLDAALNSRLRGLNPFAWGISTLEIDEAALAQGRFELKICRAIMPDGSVVDIPGDAPPDPRSFLSSALGAGLDVFLTVPARLPRVPTLTRDKDRADIRYIEREIEVADDYFPDRVQSIKVATKNLKLVMGGEPLEGRVAIRIAQIVASADGIPVLADKFVPPCVAWGASRLLEKWVVDLVQLAEARARSLTQQRKERVGDAMEFNADDILSFWYLHTLNSALTVLRQRLHRKELHPYLMFEELYRLSGALSTFDASRMGQLSFYEHENPGPGFYSLWEVLKEQLTKLFLLKYETIPMHRDEAFWTATISDPILRSSGTFILGIIGDVKTEEHVPLILRTLKIADVDRIEQIVALALAGLPVKYLTQMPRAVPVSHDGHYFQLQPDQNFWPRVQATGQIAAWLPKHIGNVRLELIGIRESSKR